MKSIRLGILIFAVVSLLSACSKREVNSVTDGPFQIMVERGSSNQLSIRLSKSSGPGVNAATGEGGIVDPDNRLFFEQGYRMAKDRFAQMDGVRRLSRARLSELLGAAAEKQDREIIAVGLPLAVRNTSEILQRDFPGTYEWLRSFSKGVNKYLKEASDTLPEPPILIQYRVFTRNDKFRLDSEESRWTPEDSIGAATNVSFYLSSALNQKLAMGIMSASKLLLGQFEEAVSLFDFRPITSTYILGAPNVPRHVVPRVARSGQKLVSPEAAAALSYRCIDRGYPFPECDRPAAVGSNSWVVSREFAGGDTAYLSNDPHLAISFPNIFYPVGLLDSKSAGGTFKLTGQALTGMPGMLIGHNDRLGYGYTNFSSDTSDAVYFLQLNSDRTQAKINGRFVRLESYSFPLNVRNNLGELERKSVTLQHVPEHGVVFSDHFPEVKEVLTQVENLNTPIFGSRLALSYRWTGHSGTRETHAVIAGLNRAQNPDDVHRALEFWDAGTQNVVYADVDGNIGYGAHGKFPIREDLSSLNPPNLLINASESDVKWKRFQTRFPSTRNPKAGFIVTANNDPFGNSHDFSSPDRYYGYGFATGIRARRITELLKAKQGNLQLEDMRRIQMDHRAELEHEFLALVEKSGVRAQLKGGAARLTDALQGWNREASIDQVEPTYAAEWAEVALAEHFKFRREDIPKAILQMIPQGRLNDVLDKVEKNWAQIAPRAYKTSLGVKTLYHSIKDGLADSTKPEFAKTVSFLRTTLERTADRLEKSGKLDVRWGEVNRLNFYNPLGALVPVAFSFPIERPGSVETVDPSWGGVVGPTFRMVMVFKRGQPIQSYLNMPGWNSPPSERERLIQEITNWRDGVLTRFH